MFKILHPLARPIFAIIPEPTPTVEPRTRAGNANPYTIRGITYHLVAQPEGFTQTGIASWYGTKFHGRNTANGEVYDMFAMTAAHKTLPIPSYVRVTRTDTQQSIVVRVNDRGPFHAGRIIDLSYTAAQKLGFADHGTAPVRVDYIDPIKTSPSVSAAPSSPDVIENDANSPPAHQASISEAETVATSEDLLDLATYLQVGAFRSEDFARARKQRITELTHYPVEVVTTTIEDDVAKSPLFKVQVGPFLKASHIDWVERKIIQANFPAPHRVYSGNSDIEQ